MDLQWYPGHMAKARKMMQEDIRLVDLLIELTDARAPAAARNPDIDELGRNRARLILLNKADLADEKQNRLWEKYFKEQGYLAAQLDSRNSAGAKKIENAVMDACKEKIARNRQKGVNRPVRAMVTGIPNVGKSTFINSLAGKASAKTGNKPGVTKGKQWIRLNKNVELLDTPGILWPKFDDQLAARLLALLGSIRDELLQTEELALWLLKFLAEYYPGLIEERYQISTEGGADEMLARIALRRGCLRKGGKPDRERAAALVTEDFRSGRIGRITIERAPNQKEDEK